MKRKRFLMLTAAFAVITCIAVDAAEFHPMTPQPKVVTTRGIDVGKAPSDAVVLFDGTGLSEWTDTEGKPSQWIVKEGAMIVNKGNIRTKREFSDVQLHIEFATPTPALGEGQSRGNSGVYLSGLYEVQVLDSYQSETYINGMIGAIYNNFSPLVNACRPPGEWQVYDIIFHAPKRLADGKVREGSFTVLQNGVLVQDHVPVGEKATAAAPIKGFAEKGPLYLQDHRNPVHFRNVWIRKLIAQTER